MFAMTIEFQILDLIQNLHTPAGDVIFPWISKLGNGGFIWIVLAAGLLVFPRTRKAGAVLVLAICVDVILTNGILKHVFARIRPCDIRTEVQLLVPRPSDFSFPSGHTAVSFAAVTALYLAGEKKLWKPALVLAVLIAFSRLYLYVHYPTDILGGMAAGAVAGYLGAYGIRKVEQWRQKRKEMA